MQDILGVCISSGNRNIFFKSKNNANILLFLFARYNAQTGYLRTVKSLIIMEKNGLNIFEPFFLWTRPLIFLMGFCECDTDHHAGDFHNVEFLPDSLASMRQVLIVIVLNLTDFL